VWVECPGRCAKSSPQQQLHFAADVVQWSLLLLLLLVLVLV
jgi:hypothetical protein